MTMVFSGLSFGASLATWATACAVSSAGMMPSVWLRSWNAWSASSSVTETYSQRPEACQAACADAGRDTSTCDSVCIEGKVQITVWVAGPDAVDTVCAGGTRDTYGPYLVTLDESGNGVSVSPSHVTLQPLTLELMNQGELSVCIAVIAPDDGEVFISELTANVGL